MNHWMELLKKLRKENPKLSFKEILKLGKKTYKKSKKHRKKSMKHRKKSNKHSKKSMKHQKKSMKHQKKSMKHQKSRGGDWNSSGTTKAQPAPPTPNEVISHQLELGETYAPERDRWDKMRI